MDTADGRGPDRPAKDDATDTNSHVSGSSRVSRETLVADGGDTTDGNTLTDSDEKTDSNTLTDGGEMTDGGGVAESGEVTGGGTTAEVDLPESDDTGFEGAPDDEEMPLTEHIEEMISRLVAVIVVMAIVSVLTFPIADRLINTLWYSFLPSPDGGISACAAAGAEAGATAEGGAAAAEGGACPRVYHPLGLIFARLKVASLAGFVIALPVFVYQTYLFMRPGLYPHERRYYLAAVPTSLLLALVGVAFAYFLILPVIFNYFLFYSEDVATIAFALSDTFDLILLMMGLFAVIFQIPLFIMLAIMMGVTTRAWLAERRLLFWFAFAGVAFLFSPDPTGMAPFFVAATMIGLFELTLGLLRWTGR